MRDVMTANFLTIRPLVQKLQLFSNFKMATAAILYFASLQLQVFLVILIRERCYDFKLYENPSFGSKGTAIIRILRWRPPPYWISSYDSYRCVWWFDFVRGILISNFMKICPLIQKIQHFLEFQDGSRRHLGLHLSVILGAFDDLI